MAILSAIFIVNIALISQTHHIPTHKSADSGQTVVAIVTAIPPIDPQSLAATFWSCPPPPVRPDLWSKPELLIPVHRFWRQIEPNDFDGQRVGPSKSCQLINRWPSLDLSIFDVHYCVRPSWPPLFGPKHYRFGSQFLWSWPRRWTTNHLSMTASSVPNFSVAIRADLAIGRQVIGDKHICFNEILMLVKHNLWLTKYFLYLRDSMCVRVLYAIQMASVRGNGLSPPDPCRVVSVGSLPL